MVVTLMLKGTSVLVDENVFAALFKDSVVSSRADVVRALDGQPLAFSTFLDLARTAEIPYPLFFSPSEVVDAQIRLKNEKLMAGFTKPYFSMHSRNRVELSDVELIVKDLLRKQELLRSNDSTLVKNVVVGLLKGSTGTVEEDANLLMRTIGISRADIRRATSKDDAVQLLIGRLEAKQIFVSRSAQHYMPQEMSRTAKFSGMTIKDKKVPFIFLASGDDGASLEPPGRKLFTLTLLTVLIARGTFAPVNYESHTKDETSPREYQVTAEILMPADEVGSMKFTDLDAVKTAANLYRVTPSAMAMRARRLRRIDKSLFEMYMDQLQDEYRQRPKQRLSSPKPVNALRNYNGIQCSRRMLAMLDAGRLSATEFRRIMFFNKLTTAHIREFREAVG
ncbi:MAG: hypothetical protein JWQ39_2171 [Glaciihabitans sp.]|nr:hypothetical protein [Glaciihabitans sp.]